MASVSNFSLFFFKEVLKSMELGRGPCKQRAIRTLHAAMQYAEDIAPQRTEQCPLEQYSFTAQQTVVTQYTLGTVK